MDEAMLTSDYPFVGMRGAWMTTAGDDTTLVATGDDMASWNEWMHYPAASQNAPGVGPKPMPVAYPAPGQQHFDTRHPSQSMQPTTIPTSASMYAQSNGVPFSFGQGVDMPPAFDFTGHDLSSPVTGDMQQPNGYYSPPMWQQQQQPQQQQQQQQQHHQVDHTLFSPTHYDQRGFMTSLPPVSTPSLHHSPSSPDHGRASSSSSHSSPEPMTSSKKRKAPSESDDHDDESPASRREKSQPPKKTAHNMIEKRYRNNLNDKIAALRDSVPSLRVMSRPNGTEEDDDPEDLEGLTPAHKLNKATVLSKATEYIRHLEKRNKRLQDQVNTLKDRVESYEKMAISGPMTLHGTGGHDGTRYHEDQYPTHGIPMSGPPQGMIPVPENIAALQRGLPPQAHYAPAYPPYAGGNSRQGMPGPPMVNGRRNGALMGKLMVGSLAGIMVLEGLVEREQSQEEPAGRGLFALPINLAGMLTPRASFGVTGAQIPIAKLLLVFGAFFYILAPLLDFTSKPKKKASSAASLRPAPSLASPVEVRRTAWLTSIQTVWVPQHNFVLEVAALGLKSLKLSLRKIIGWQGYAYLTGITKDQEAARAKAWAIALDAQLTGGDAEISKSRLVLSLMASGTLPDTPARLMLKAIHIRVLLWEIGNAMGHSSWWIINNVSAKLARHYWNLARSEHRIAANMTSKPDSEAEPLPEHLAALIERECDEVFVSAIVQRAYNLAWNRPSAEKTIIDSSMDGVVEDSAISSPLDALAAWYSSIVLNKALAGYLASKIDSPKESVISDLDLALHSAPPNSQAHLRALVAQTVVLDDDRDTRIATALKALPLPASSQSNEAGLINPVDDNPTAIDVRKALTLAKCLVLIDSPSPDARQRATFVVNNTFLPEVATTLLSFVAAYKVLTRFMRDPEAQAQTGAGLERIASSLRMWVGHETGRRSGLTNKARKKVVENCLDAIQRLVGVKEKEKEVVDDGYASASVEDD